MEKPLLKDEPVGWTHPGEGEGCAEEGAAETGICSEHSLIPHPTAPLAGGGREKTLSVSL